MISHWVNRESSSAEWLRECIDMESEGQTLQLPVICAEAAEVAALTPEQVRAALAEEFGERVAA